MWDFRFSSIYKIKFYKQTLCVCTIGTIVITLKFPLQSQLYRVVKVNLYPLLIKTHTYVTYPNTFVVNVAHEL